MATFIKATLVPNHQGASAFQPKQIILSTSVIIAISLRQGKEYELILTTQALKQLQDEYWGQNTTIKTVIATIKNEAILL